MKFEKCNPKKKVKDKYPIYTGEQLKNTSAPQGVYAYTSGPSQSNSRLNDLRYLVLGYAIKRRTCLRIDTKLCTVEAGTPNDSTEFYLTDERLIMDIKPAKV